MEGLKGSVSCRFCELLSAAVEHLGLESLVHLVLRPLRISVEIQIPVIYPRHMHAIPVQLNHIKVITTVLVALLVLEIEFKTCFPQNPLQGL